MSLRVAAFTQGRDEPSARFRLRQYLAPLAAQGIEVDELIATHGSFPPAGLGARLRWLPLAVAERRRAVRRAYSAGRHHLAFFQRELVSTLCAAEKLWRGPAVLDADDAIWLTQRFASVDRIARHCGHVICGNAWLAEHFHAFAQVHLLPTPVDTQRYRVGGERASRPLLCWSGSSSGLPYLEALEPALATVFEAIPSARLQVLSNGRPRFRSLAADRVECRDWAPDVEVSTLQAAWVGLMPMPDTQWTRGKCSYKMLTYMACGTPAVASPWGMNAEVIARGEGARAAISANDWADQLIALLREPERLDEIGAAGRRTVEAHYSLAVLAPRLAEILRKVAG